MKITEGYYWVRIDGDWTIGQYLDGGLWSFIDKNDIHTGDDIEEIGNRIER